MVADVPLGMFLSGGIDSSTIAALMQANSARPIRTFSIGFRERGYDEAADARRVAAHLGTEHTELYVTPAEARAVIPKLPQIYDEPFADPSEIPTYLVSEMTRRHVTVALSGDGGDEVFAGYNRYIQGLALAKAIAPAAARRCARPRRRDRFRPARRLGPAVPRSPRAGFARAWQGKKCTNSPPCCPRIGRLLRKPGCARRTAPNPCARGGRGQTRGSDDGGAHGRVRRRHRRGCNIATRALSARRILTKVDRASMAVSLEVRVPLPRSPAGRAVVAAAARFKLRGGTGKWILRQIAYKYVPRKLLERPKMGFAVPVDEWLRGPLKEWAGDLLSPQALGRAGLLEPAPIAQKWHEHQSGTAQLAEFPLERADVPGVALESVKAAGDERPAASGCCLQVGWAGEAKQGYLRFAPGRCRSAQPRSRRRSGLPAPDRPRRPRDLPPGSTSVDCRLCASSKR